jgi:hypothetical protein
LLVLNETKKAVIPRGRLLPSGPDGYDPTSTLEAALVSPGREIEFQANPPSLGPYGREFTITKDNAILIAPEWPYTEARPFTAAMPPLSPGLHCLEADIKVEVDDTIAKLRLFQIQARARGVLLVEVQLADGKWRSVGDPGRAHDPGTLCATLNHIFSDANKDLVSAGAGG